LLVRALKRFPPAAAVEQGAVVLWANPNEKNQLRTSLFAIVLTAGVLGWAASSYAASRAGKRKRTR
jgi:hypothetical protein